PDVPMAAPDSRTRPSALVLGARAGSANTHSDELVAPAEGLVTTATVDQLIAPAERFATAALDQLVVPALDLCSARIELDELVAPSCRSGRRCTRCHQQHRAHRTAEYRCPSGPTCRFLSHDLWLLSH